MKKLTGKPKISERLFQQSIIDAARALGYLCYHTFDSRRSAKGFPDLVLCHPRRFKLYFVEVKTDMGKMMPYQEVWLDALSTTLNIDTLPGMGAYVIRPADFDWFWEELKR